MSLGISQSLPTSPTTLSYIQKTFSVVDIMCRLQTNIYFRRDRPEFDLGIGGVALVRVHGEGQLLVLLLDLTQRRVLRHVKKLVKVPKIKRTFILYGMVNINSTRSLALVHSSTTFNPFPSKKKVPR